MKKTKPYVRQQRDLWSDWQRRGKWVPVLLGLEKFAGFSTMVEQKLNGFRRLLGASI